MTSLADLRKKAEAATKGRWEMDDFNIVCFTDQDEVFTIVQTDNGYYPPNSDDASFICEANPSTILALLDLIEELREALVWIEGSQRGETASIIHAHEALAKLERMETNVKY